MIDLPRVPPYEGGGGEGIIIPAGGSYLIGAWMVIGLIRHFRCPLPIEVWHQGQDELNWIARAIISAWDSVTFHDIGRPGGPQGQGGWQLKAEALAATKLDEVLLLDADNQPLMSPGSLFYDQGYVQRGSMFWPSFNDRLTATHSCWPRFGLEPRDTPGLDSAQLLVDRRKSWAGVCLAAFLNRNSHIYWRDLWGDKDTFLLAWLKTDTAYALVDRQPERVGGSLFHRTPGGRLCFRHRYGEKWSFESRQWENPIASALLKSLRDQRQEFQNGNGRKRQ